MPNSYSNRLLKLTFGTTVEDNLETNSYDREHQRSLFFSRSLHCRLVRPFFGCMDAVLMSNLMLPFFFFQKVSNLLD